MSKLEIKELSFFIIISIVNIFIAFAITNLLGISNTIVVKSYSVLYGDITWEVLIFMTLSIIEATIYEIIKENKIITEKRPAL